MSKQKEQKHSSQRQEQNAYKFTNFKVIEEKEIEDLKIEYSIELTLKEKLVTDIKILADWFRTYFIQAANALTRDCHHILISM